MDIEVLDLAFKLIHDCRDLLEIHGVQSFVQRLGDLTHAFGHLLESKEKAFVTYVSYTLCDMKIVDLESFISTQKNMSLIQTVQLTEH